MRIVMPDYVLSGSQLYVSHHILTVLPLQGYTVNPDFIYQPVTNDVAIIKFGGVSKFPTANMATVLPPVGTQLTSVGWGADQQTSATGVYPKNLQ